MSINEGTRQLTVERLLDNVRQLSPTELWEFTERFAEWQKLRDIPDEAALLASIYENSCLPGEKHQRYQALWRKCEDETITDAELAEYQTLLSELYARNLKRIESLMALGKRRGKTLREMSAELGLTEVNDAF